MADSGSPSATAAALAAKESEVRAAGAPYAPLHAALGSPPSPNPDIPISAVFLVIYIICGIINFSLLIKNKKRGRKFTLSMPQSIFCLIRIASTCLRIGWACHPSDIHMAIASGIFLYAGAVVLFIVNLVLAERLMRALHPRIGWNKLYTAMSWVVPTVIIVAVVCTIVTESSISFFTLNPNTLRIERNINIAILTTYVLFSSMPLFEIAFMFIWPRRTPYDNFGFGSLRTKVLLVLTASSVMTLGAGYRAGIDWLDPVPYFEHPWYYSKACFYNFNFTVEVIMLILYLVFRVDKRFHVPAGARGPGSYMIMAEKAQQKQWPDTPSLPRSNSDNNDVEKEKGRSEPRSGDATDEDATPITDRSITSSTSNMV